MWRRNTAGHVVGLLLALAGLTSETAVAQDTATGSWKNTGFLSKARSAHTATLLPNGKVLVMGGFGDRDDGALDIVELYDPATETWSVTSRLHSARRGYTATLLPNGKVLVAGGFGGFPDGALSSAEVYDPPTETWTVTGNLNMARGAHTATMLPNGQVLVAGGFVAGSYVSTAELYDPDAGTWRMTGSLPSWERFGEKATLLPNGKVLLVGGNNENFSLRDALLYDPATEMWRPTGSLNTPRDGHTATLLPNGKVLVAGGTVVMGPSAGINAELYDPDTEMWSPTGSLNTERDFHTATLLPNGKALVAGGSLIRPRVMTNAVELYDPATGTWSAASALNTARDFHTGTLLANGKVLVVGGSGNNPRFAPLESAELFDLGLPAAVTGDPDTSFGTGGTVLTDFFGGSDLADALAIQADGKIIAAGGTNLEGFGSDFALARYNTDGTLDTTFGIGGKVTTDFGSNDVVSAVAIQSDGKIIAGGGTHLDIEGVGDFALARYNADGTPDTTFGTEGKVIMAGGAVSAVVIQSDGKIVTAGGGGFELARFNTDGTLEMTFGLGGKVNPGYGSWSQAVALQSDGKITTAGVVGGRGGLPGVFFIDFTLRRYNPDGTPDTTFGSGGQVVTDFFSNNDYARAVAIQADGKIIAAGLAFTGSRETGGSSFDFALARYNTDGTLDTTFGSGGKVIIDFGDYDVAYAVAIQSDGRIVAAGGASGNFQLARLNVDGTLDTTFGTGAKVTAHFGGNGGAALAVGIQSDGKIVAVGTAGGDFVLARYGARDNNPVLVLREQP